MTRIDLKLAQEEAEKLADIAQREGVTPAALALSAVRERLATEAEIEAAILNGFAEIERGEGVPLDKFEADMDRFMQRLLDRGSSK